MKPIYAMVNIDERDEFEKHFQIPYGYSQCYMTYDFDLAIRVFDNLSDGEKEVYVIESVDSEGREIVYSS